MANTPLDLSQLALDRSPSEEPKKRPRRRRWLTRYVVPAAILFGFAGLLGVSAGARLLPQPSVQVVPVIVKRAEVQQAGTTLFQAAGWIEPRPTATSVAALAPGVIEELLVVEGQQVAKGEAIARLITIDAELALQQAKATLALHEGELQRAQAEHLAAGARLEQPVHLQVQLADANGTLAKANTELGKLPFLIEAAEARVRFTLHNLEGKQSARAAIAGRVVQQAQGEHAEAQAVLQGLRGREPNLRQEIAASQDKVDALQTQLALLIEEKRQLQEADAKLQSAAALRDQAEVQLRQAALALERNIIRAPISGRILRLIATPGTRVMGLDMTSGPSSSTVVEMYDPARLQVRADVRLEDVPMVQPGQPVEIETASVAGVIHGRVLQATSTANIQKNTLEVKVELLDPPQAVTPEMLVTATFLAPESNDASAESTETERVFVPQQLVQTGEAGSFVWIVDAEDRAQRQPITPGQPTPDGLVEVQQGLAVTDKLIASGTAGLQQADLVRISGEDLTMGVQ